MRFSKQITKDKEMVKDFSSGIMNFLMQNKVVYITEITCSIRGISLVSFYQEATNYIFSIIIIDFLWYSNCSVTGNTIRPYWRIACIYLLGLFAYRALFVFPFVQVPLGPWLWSPEFLWVWLESQ